MRRTICCLLPRLLITLMCGLGILTLLLASPLGLDPDPGWGPHKIALLLVFIAGLILAQGPFLARILLRRLRRRQPPASQETPSALADHPPTPPITPKYAFPVARPWNKVFTPAVQISLVMLFLLIEIGYIWFASVGYWSDWPKTSGYYDLLAQAFLQGSPALLVEPDPRLAELPDPYPIAARENIPVLWDASYYQGNYYLYWGPVPALVLAAIKAISPQEIGDQYIVFVSISFVFLFTALILLELWKTFYASLPKHLLLAGLLLAGMAHPLLWVLNRPAIHEAAIASGAAFLMAGIYFALPMLISARFPVGKIVLASICWGLALASRLSLIGGIGCLVGIILIRLVVSWYRNHAAVKPSLFISLLLPIGLIAGLLGYYNYIRFNDPLESGWTYVLSGRTESHEDLSLVFNPLYSLPNTYNYFAAPVRTLSVFPYFKPAWGRGSLAPLPISLPKMYYAEQLSGLLLTTPIVVFIGALIWWITCRNAKCSEHVRHAPPAASPAEKNLEFALSVLLLTTIGAFLPIIVFFSASTRYVLDISPLLTILACNGAWLAFIHLQNHPIKRRILLVLIFISTIASAGMSFLLAITGFESRFENLNPVLFEWLVRFFTP